METFDLANMFIFVKKYEKAMPILKNLSLSEVYSDNVLLHWRMVELAIFLKKEHDILHANYGKEKKIEKIALALATAQDEKIFEYLQKEYGDMPCFSYGIATCLEQKGEIHQAISFYKKSIDQDPHWYPSYFSLSQIFFSLGKDTEGSQYISLFEEKAPFHIYGKVETHYNIYQTFLNMELWEEALSSLDIMKQWWNENEQKYPIEIQLLEELLKIKIDFYQKFDISFSMEKFLFHLRDVLKSKSILYPNALYIMAMNLDVFDQTDWLKSCLKKILNSNKKDYSFNVLQYFISKNDYKEASFAIKKIYEKDPQKKAIRLYRIMIELKKHSLEISSYLKDKECIVYQYQKNKQDISSVLNLYEVCKKDCQIIEIIADHYLNRNDYEKSYIFFEKLSKIEYMNEKILIKKLEISLKIKHLSEKDFYQKLNRISDLYKNDKLWIEGQFFLLRGQKEKSTQLFLDFLDENPWNEHVLKTLISIHEPNWMIDMKHPNEFKSKEKNQSMVYQYEKLFYISSHGENIHTWTMWTMDWNPQKMHQELMLILNTDLEHADIFVVLGKLAQGAWMHEVACLWFDKGLSSCKIQGEKDRILLNMSLSHIFLNHIDKAYHAILNVIESSKEKSIRLAHIYIKKGLFQKAKEVLETLVFDMKNSEEIYVLGLYFYKKGQKAKGKDIWKHILERSSESTFTHYLKKNIYEFI